ncbi:MAG: hypothetical protein IT382_25765 [Deltaproteobacteria bacterium]|nr:hypothetical protein [Deltaproteobacteria bacterium]
MSTQAARIARLDAATLRAEGAVVTLFDRADPASCLMVRLAARAGGLAGHAPGGSALVDRIRFGLRPAFFAVVDNALVEGELEARVLGRVADSASPASHAPGFPETLLLELRVVWAGPAAEPADTPTSVAPIPRT